MQVAFLDLLGQLEIAQRVALVGAAIWMSIGIFTIKKMIAFEF